MAIVSLTTKPKRKYSQLIGFESLNLQFYRYMKIYNTYEAGILLYNTYIYVAGILFHKNT